MRICFYSHYYPPEVNAPASRTSEHCRAWAQAGHDVTVVTCAPNHPSGKIYAGYRNRILQREMIDGVNVVRVWTFLAANEGFLRRTLNYLSFLTSATLTSPWMKRPDVVISTSPQLFCGLMGLVCKTFWRVPWVLEIRDLWPESIVSVGAMRRGAAVRLLERIEALAYRQADCIVSVTDSFVPHIVGRGGDAAKIHVIKNGVDLALFRKDASASDIKRALKIEGRFVAAYVGTHGMAHGLHTILEAAEQLRDDPRIAFLMVGDGAERGRLIELAKEKGLDNVRIIGQLPKADMPGVWAATDASLIVLRRSDLFKKVIPSKMFEAMAMSCPIILGVEGEARELLEDAGAGLAITPESATELAAAITKLADDPALAARFGERGNRHVREHYDRAKLAERYFELLQTTADERVAASSRQSGKGGRSAA